MKLKLIVLIVLISGCVNVVTSQEYIFYLHGKIVENQGAKAVDETNGYGSYLYDDILDSLKKDGAIVLSEVRPMNTDIKIYAKKIQNEIGSLIKLGVKPESITVIGASKGASIAMYVSSYLKNQNINFVFMAACNNETQNPELNCYGNILSIYELSDFAGTCKELIKASKGINHFKEIQLNTGLRHGFLYKPLAEWINPSLQWSKANYN